MSFTKKTVREIDLTGKRVLMRADYNVPVDQGVITDNYRIKRSVPTIRYILDQPGASLIIISHLGRPKSSEDKQFSLEPVARQLSQYLGREVKFVPACTGDEVKRAADQLQPGQILLLENVRFHPEEESNDPRFAKAIAEACGAAVFVQDGFGVVHRAHATTVAIAELLPAVAGLLLAKEVDTITKVMEDPERPLMAVVGGAKISDKIEVLYKLIDIADCLAVGGALANNFLLAQGIKVGKSLVEPDVVDTALEVVRRAREVERQRPFSFLVPSDVVVSTSADGTAPTRVVDLTSHSLADIEAYPKLPQPNSYTIGDEEMILDIGPLSALHIAGVIKFARTVIWNGPCGVTEVKGLAGAHNPFAHGTRLIADAMIGTSNSDKNKPFTLVGGGDTAAYIEAQGMLEDFNHVSTGGGATLDLMAGKTLPGVVVLQNKDS